MMQKKITIDDTRVSIAAAHQIEKLTTIADRHEFVTSLTTDIQDSDIGYAGFKTKEGLIEYLDGAVFDKDQNTVPTGNIAVTGENIISIVERALTNCTKTLRTDSLSVFVFPTFSKFVAEKMFGTTGYTPWKQVMLIFINSRNKEWQHALVNTVVHEYNHNVFLEYHACESLLDALIMEGLAEHFRERVVGGEQSPWVTALNESKSKEIFEQLEGKELLHSTDPSTRREVFFGSDAYALWTGYAVGYQIVRTFLEKTKKVVWTDIMKLPPSVFIKDFRS